MDDITKQILSGLDRIEKKLDRHMDSEERRIDGMDRKLTKVENNVKWHSAIAGGVGSAIAIVIGYLGGQHS